MIIVHRGTYFYIELSLCIRNRSGKKMTNEGDCAELKELRDRSYTTKQKASSPLRMETKLEHRLIRARNNLKMSITIKNVNN